LGTAVAVDLAARKACAGVVLEAPGRSAARWRRYCLFRSADHAGFDSKGRSKVRSAADDPGDAMMIPYGLGRDFAARSQNRSGPSKAEHNDLLEDGDRYREHLGHSTLRFCTGILE
jgi:hypothetical protein